MTKSINNKEVRQAALRIARFVRDGLEDLHCKGVTMTDDNMPDINRAIRKSIYKYIRLVGLFQSKISKKEKDNIQSLLNFISPPHYWEEDVFDDVDKEIDNLLKKINNV